jgi:hypothetical protein
MKRAILLVPFVVLAACADSPFEPGQATLAPQMATTFTNSGGATLDEGTGCTRSVGADSVECAFMASNLSEGLVHGVPGTVWSLQYQCVHRKNGNVNKQHPPIEKELRPSTAFITGMTVDGKHSGSWTIPAPGPQAWVDLCSSNKGAFTATQLLAGPTPVSYSIIAWSDVDVNSWAMVVGDFD